MKIMIAVAGASVDTPEVSVGLLVISSEPTH